MTQGLLYERESPVPTSGAEGTRTPDPHTASPDARGPRMSTEVRTCRSAGESISHGLLCTATDSAQLCPELGHAGARL